MSPRPEHPGYLRQRRTISHRMVQHIEAEDEIKTIVQERQRLRVDPRVGHACARMILPDEGAGSLEDWPFVVRSYNFQ